MRQADVMHHQDSEATLSDAQTAVLGHLPHDFKPQYGVGPLMSCAKAV